jgi:hypothetical protein
MVQKILNFKGIAVVIERTGGAGNTGRQLFGKVVFAGQL